MTDHEHRAGHDFDPTLRPIAEGLNGDLEYYQRPAGTAFKYEAHTSSMRGWCRGITIRPGFSIALSDVHYTDERVFSYVGGDHLKLHFRLSGSSVIGSERTEDIPVPTGLMVFLVQPSDSLKYERVMGGDHERSITMICSKEFVSELLSSGDEDIPRAISDFLGAGPSRFSSSSLPIQPRVWPIVEDILNPTLTGALDTLIMEAKALELLCLGIKQILNKAHAVEAVRPRDRQKIEHLCRMLDDDRQAVLSIPALCRELAWNETQMMECFKQVTGTTITNYRQRVRMESALRLLRDSDSSITEVAFSAGYDHPANFSTAFKRTFGFSPREARRGCLGGEGGRLI